MSERETAHLTCTACPIGCALVLTHEGREIVEIRGASCDRGAKYGAAELIDPQRQLSTTVAITGARWARLPVKVTRPLPKALVREAVRQIHAISVRAPVEQGQILLADLLGREGTHVIATRSMG